MFISVTVRMTVTITTANLEDQCPGAGVLPFLSLPTAHEVDVIIAPISQVKRLRLMKRVLLVKGTERERGRDSVCTLVTVGVPLDKQGDRQAPTQWCLSHVPAGNPIVPAAAPTPELTCWVVETRSGGGGDLRQRQWKNCSGGGKLGCGALEQEDTGGRWGSNHRLEQ